VRKRDREREGIEEERERGDRGSGVTAACVYHGCALLSDVCIAWTVIDVSVIVIVNYRES
jgi:hypothetical protein